MMMIDLSLMAETLQTIRRLKVDKVNPLEVISSEVNTLVKMQDELNPLIETLPKQTDRFIMKLRFMKGLTIREIVDSANLSQRSIFYHLSAAVKWLVLHYPEQIITPSA